MLRLQQPAEELDVCKVLPVQELRLWVLDLDDDRPTVRKPRAVHLARGGGTQGLGLEVQEVQGPEAELPVDDLLDDVQWACEQLGVLALQVPKGLCPRPGEHVLPRGSDLSQLHVEASQVQGHPEDARRVLPVESVPHLLALLRDRSARRLRGLPAEPPLRQAVVRVDRQRMPPEPDASEQASGPCERGGRVLAAEQAPSNNIFADLQDPWDGHAGEIALQDALPARLQPRNGDIHLVTKGP
mmetsp:Transcript_16331/g.57034  ORF Transcript_16331/g.57034 Transcript_16331/m.57034 type:complete len:242 (-) Transcript_16331:60-785(-)